MDLEGAIRGLREQIQEVKTICDVQVQEATDNRARIFAELEGEHLKRRNALEEDYRVAEIDFARRIESYRKEQAELTKILDRLKEEVQTFRARLSTI